MIEVLRTKLFVPRPRKNLVARPRLVDCLNEGLDKKLTLIAAPAGFGKTTLLSEWIPLSPRCVTWLSLEQSDNDPARFWVYFIASLQRLSPQLGENALALLQSSQAPPTTSVVTILINEITAFEEVFAIVLDDYHTIESPSIHQSLTFLIEHLPGNMHVLMTTRVDPPLPIARLRVRDQLTEIRAHDLRFSEDEAAAFLTQVMGLELSVAQVAMLEIRTEGWIAGLQIAALSMQGRKDVSGFLRAFSGSHRHVLGYLAEEVINQQPDEIQNFLLQTSILNALCGPLCEAVTGEQGGQAILEKLEHANLFITPLDDERRWYRYHHLFAEVLQARLQQTQRIRIPQLHRRASTWFEGSGQVAEAIDHAISGEDFRRAGELIASAIPSYHFKGSVATLIKWIDRLPEVHLVESAELLSQKGWLLYLSGQIDLAQQHAAKARAYIKREVTPVAYGRLAFLNSQFAVFEGNIAGAIDYAFEALELIGDRDPYVRSLILTTLAMAQPVLGNTSDTIERLEEAARISEGLRQPLATLSAYAKYADQLNLHGRLQEGQKVCEHALGLFADGSGQPSPIAGIAFVSAAKLAYEENDLAKTDRYLREASIREKLLGLTGLTFEITYMDALLAWARGDVDKALRVVRHGCETADQMEQKGYISIFTLLETDLLLKSESLTAPNAWLEAGNRSNRDASSLFQIHENTVFARYLIWQNRLPEASHMLEELEKTSIRSGYIRYQLAVLVLQALLCERQGGPEKAIENLERAIQQAAPQKYRRVFLDEGEGIRPLLMRYQSIMERQVSERVLPESPIPLRFVEELLSEISPHARIEQTRHGTLSEPLSTRELEILRLIAAGRSNQEIAEILVIAVSTVKSHINNLYGKLGTNRRTEAIAIARDQGLLSG